MLNIDAKQLQNAMAQYKTGFGLSPTTHKEDRTKSQKLPKPAQTSLIENLAESLTSSLQSVCPITGLTTSINFPAKPGFYIEAYHPIVHNCKAMVKDYTYTLLLDKEQKAGLILAALSFYSLLSLEAPALVVNLKMQLSLSDHQLEQFLDFIRNGVAGTNKGYPLLSLDASCNEQTFLSYISKCHDIEHTNLDPLTLENADPLTKKLFEVPKFLASDKRGSAMDKEAYETWLDIVSEDILPDSLVVKAKPFAKTLVTNPSSSLITKLLAAVKGKAVYSVATTLSETSAEALVDEFILLVETSRDTAAKLKLYPDLSAGLFETETSTSTSLEEQAAGEPSRTPSAKEETAVKEMSPFEARLAAMKAKGVI